MNTHELLKQEVRYLIANIEQLSTLRPHSMDYFMIQEEINLLIKKIDEIIND